MQSQIENRTRESQKTETKTIKKKGSETNLKQWELDFLKKIWVREKKKTKMIKKKGIEDEKIEFSQENAAENILRENSSNLSIDDKNEWYKW